MKKLAILLTAILSMSVTPAPLMKPLAWEQPNKPGRQKWSEHTFQNIYRNFDKLDKAIDMQYFCPEYNRIDRDKRINAWGQLIAAIAWYESGWNPRARAVQPSFGLDRITGETVVAEGLFQLGYMDSLWRDYCDFDWYGDRVLNDDDLNRTMINPRSQIRCTVGILADQVARHGRIVIPHGAYWSVLMEGHRNQRIDGIRRMVSRMPGCLGEEG
jgi:hypothetical protein